MYHISWYRFAKAEGALLCDSCLRPSCTVLANNRCAASNMVLRIVETPSCTRKNKKIRSHAGYSNALPMVETPSYTRENISNRSYTDSNTGTQCVPTAKLGVCDATTIGTIKTL